MNIFEEAAAVLNTWNIDGETYSQKTLEPLENIWSDLSPSKDSFMRPASDSKCSSLHGPSQGLSQLLENALGGFLTWEASDLDKKHADTNWKDGDAPWSEMREHPGVQQAALTSSLDSPEAEEGGPSRWQLLASYTNKGQIPPPQSLSTEPNSPPEKQYNPTQYMETLQSNFVNERLQKQTLASVARHGKAEAKQARPTKPVKEYDPRLVMEIRHQNVQDKRQKRVLQKADILAQGRAALAEARGNSQPVSRKAASNDSTPRVATHKAERTDNRVVAYQKRKLAVQEEQQRLEAEVQRLRAQIREDAESHRKARRDTARGRENHESPNPHTAAGGFGTVAKDRHVHSSDRSATALGVLTENRRSNWQERGRPRGPAALGAASRGAPVCARGVDGRKRGFASAGDRTSIGDPETRGLDGTAEELVDERQSAKKVPESLGFAVHVGSLEGLEAAERLAGADAGGLCPVEVSKEEESGGIERAVGNLGSSGQSSNRAFSESFSYKDSAPKGLGPSSRFARDPSAVTCSASVNQEAEPVHSASISPDYESAVERGTEGVARDHVTTGSDCKASPNTLQPGCRPGSFSYSLLPGALQPGRQPTTDACEFVASLLSADEGVRGEDLHEAQQPRANPPRGASLEAQTEGLGVDPAAASLVQQAESIAQKRVAMEAQAAAAAAVQQLRQAEVLRDRELATTLELLLTTKEKRTVRQAWSTWRAETVGARAPLQRAMIVLQWRRMALLWGAWRNEVQSGKEYRTKQLVEAELRVEASASARAHDHWRLRLLSQSFVLWNRFSSKECLKKEVQTQHAARAHKMRALLSKQEALRLSLLWKDRKYRAGEVDAPGGPQAEQRPDEATGTRAGTPTFFSEHSPTLEESTSHDELAQNGAEGKVDNFPLSADQFPVHLEEHADVRNEREKVIHTERDAGQECSEDAPTSDGTEASVGVRVSSASTSEPVCEKGPGWKGGFDRTEGGHDFGTASPCDERRSSLQQTRLRIISTAGKLASGKEQSGFREGRGERPDLERGSRMASHADVTGECEDRILNTGVGNGSEDACESLAYEHEEDLRFAGLERGLGFRVPRGLGELGGNDLVDKMEQRAAARRARRGELRLKYEEALRKKLEEQEAAERRRVEAERLEKSAELARKAEESRARRDAEQAAARCRELATQQLELAKIHYKRHVLLRFGWNPWRKLIAKDRTRVESSLAHFRHFLHRAAWQAWRAYFETARDEHEQHERAQIAAALTHWGARAWGRTWAWWRLVVGARRKGVEKRMTRAFFSWREAAANIRERCEEAAAQRARALQSCAWRGWRARAEEERDVRLLKEVADGARADRFAERSLSKRAFWNWADAVAAAKAAVEKRRQEDATWAKINGWLTEHRKAKSTSVGDGIESQDDKTREAVTH